MAKIVIAGSKVFTVGMTRYPLFLLDGKFNASKSNRPRPSTVEIQGIGTWIVYNFNH